MPVMVITVAENRQTLQVARDRRGGDGGNGSRDVESDAHRHTFLLAALEEEKEICPV